MKKFLNFACMILCLMFIGTFTVACGGGGGGDSASGGGFGYIPMGANGENNGTIGSKNVTLNEDILQQLCEIGIIDTTDKTKLTSIDIPANYNYKGTTYTINAIGDYAFAITENNSKSLTKDDSEKIITENNTTLKKVIIPNTVTKIGKGAFFGCTALETLNIPATVTEIGSNAFYNVPKITYTGNAEGAVNAWGAESANSDNYTEIELDSETIERLTTLGVFETDDLGRRTNVFIPSVFEYNGTKYKITKIAKEAFKGQTTLTSITIPNTITEIGSNAFQDCTSLITVIIGDGVKNLGKMTTDNVTENIGIFSGCSSLKNVIIGKGVESIVATFQDCTSLENINIPNNVKYIGWCCFSGCSSLKNFPIGNGVETIGKYAFSNTYVSDSYCLPFESITIPDTVKTIEEAAFYRYTTLKNITIGNGVETISGNAFQYCTSLKEITFGSDITTIGKYAFSNCTSLETTIPDTVTTIGEYAFYDVKHVYYNGTADDPNNNH